MSTKRSHILSDLLVDIKHWRDKDQINVLWLRQRYWKYNTETVVRRCSSKYIFLTIFIKKVLLKISQNCVWGLQLYLKKTPTQVFSCEICEIFTSANDCFWCSTKKLLWKVSENYLVKIHGGVFFQVRFQLLSLQLYKERTSFCGFFLEFPNIIQRTIFQTCLSDNSKNVDYAHKFSFNKINSSIQFIDVGAPVLPTLNFQ